MSKIMKRVLVAVLAIVMALSFTILFAGCSDGQDGKSAYEIAKDHGFTGTEQEWLDSLKGNNGYGVDGSAWHTGKGLPSDTTAAGAKAGDFYINLNTNTIYRKTASTWELIANINDNNNVSKWDGTIPGWTQPNLSDDQVVKNRPVSYVVDEDLHRIDLYNAEAFAWFAYRAVLGKQGFKDWTVNLYCDVDLDNQMWVPIGLGARSNAPKMAFQGTFNGNGHTIYNLNSKAFYDSIRYGAYTEVDGTAATGYYISYMHKPTNTEIKIPFQVKENRSNGTHNVGQTEIEYKEGDEFNYGLFAKTYNATIRDLNIKGVRLDMPEKVVTGAPNSLKTDSVGTIIGFAQGSITVENCTVGQFEHDSTVGYIRNCNTVGGIIGRVYAGTDAKGTGLANPTDTFGRIIIKNCTNNLDIYGSAIQDGTSDVAVLGDNKAGGMISFPGYFSNMVVENCVNNGDITARRAGGMIAYNSVSASNTVVTATIRNCTNNGKISSSLVSGGIIGERMSSSNKTMYTIQNCTNRGDIVLENFAPSTSSAVNFAAGGLIGVARLGANEKGMIVHSNNSGNVIIGNGTQTVTAYEGAIVGYATFAKSGSKIGQITIACGNNGDVIDKSPATVTVVESNMTDDAGKVGIGYVNGSTNVDEQINVVYFANIGERKTETPAA